MSTLRHRLGAIVYDWPRFLRATSGHGRWATFHNRDERLTIDPDSGGARCEWMFSSDLHIAGVFPSTGRRLMKRAFADWPIESASEPRVSGTPAVSFIIGHRGEARLPLLLETLGSIAAQRDVPVECIVVEQSETPGAELPSWVRRVHTPIESDALPYNRSWAFNAGAEVAQSRLLVLHDNDILVPAAYASELVKRHAEGHEFIDLKRFLFYLDERKQLERISQNLLGGSIAADRDAYFAIGGFDESFVGWGGEDNEFHERAATRRTFAFGYLPFIHLWHAPQAEKPGAQAAGGAARYAELSRIPPETRIRALRQKRS